MSTAFETIDIAVQKARSQFSVLHSTQEDNVEVIQELAEAFMAELQQLVHLAGGDNSFLTPVVEGIRNDIDLCFFAENNSVVKDVFKPRAGLLKLIVQGASMGEFR
ncbi:hypothetical protein [Rhizobium leguminosarum]